MRQLSLGLTNWEPELIHSPLVSCDQITEAAEMATSAPREKLYKILVIGDLGTGKTSIIKRYVHQCFSPHYRATIGVDFALKVLNWDAKTIIRLQLWDIAGQERFGSMTRVYYKEAAGAFIVFDVTRSSTFEAVKIWKKDLDNKCFGPDGSPVPAVLLGNKCDLPSETNQQTMDDFCADNSFLGYFPTSAKEDIGIGDAARGLVAEILKREESVGGGVEDDKEDQVRLQDPVIKKNGGSCCRKS